MSSSLFLGYYFSKVSSLTEPKPKLLHITEASLWWIGYFRKIILIANYSCWRHTVPKLTQDRNTMIYIFSNLALIVKTSSHSWGHIKPSYGRRWTFSDSGSNFVSGTKIFGMSKNSRKASRRCLFVLNSWVHPALREAILKASRERVVFVSSSVTSDIFHITNTIRRKQKHARLS